MTGRGFTDSRAVSRLFRWFLQAKPLKTWRPQQDSNLQTRAAEALIYKAFWLLRERVLHCVSQNGGADEHGRGQGKPTGRPARVTAPTPGLPTAGDLFDEDRARQVAREGV